MKKLLTVVLAMAALLALAVPARADVLYEPRNMFFAKHRDECTSVERDYYANGGEGFVTVWNAPDGYTVKGQFENGTVLRVTWRYEDWACIAYYQGERTEGWVPLANLQLIYDSTCFAEEYADRITPYGGEFADYEGEAMSVNFYEYPGAAEVRRTFNLSVTPEILDHLTGASDGESYIQSVFVDEEGRTWGFVGYMYGRMNAWFCLDQPDGEDFPVREIPDPGLVPARTPVLPAAGYVPYALVGAVVLATGLLLVLFFRKKRR